MKNKAYLTILLFLPFVAVAQVIPLANRSFEDIPQHSKAPKGWYDCGFPGESPPDTQPDPKATFQVTKEAYDGYTYLGMVVRDNNTWESVTQKLPKSLENDSCYTFSVYVARSKTYISSSRVTDEQANYDTPTTLRLYAGFDYCDKAELLATSNAIQNFDWKEWKFSFTPKRKYTHILIEAYYHVPTLFPYNGNVLVDYAQLIKGCGAAIEALLDSNSTIETQTVEEPPTKSPIAEKEPVKKVKRERKAVPLPAELPKNLEELTTAIAALGKEVYFMDNSANFEPHQFTLNGQAYQNTNQYLTFIAKAMQQFPDYRLLVSVDGDDELRYVRTVNLQEQLLQLGLDQDHLTVYPYNDLDQRKQWLWTPTDNDLLMQIVPIKK